MLNTSFSPWPSFTFEEANAVQRLCGNLQVDISKARDLLGWTPPLSVEEGLKRAVGNIEK